MRTLVTFEQIPTHFTLEPCSYRDGELAVVPQIGDGIHLYSDPGCAPATLEVVVRSRRFIYSKELLTIEVFCEAVSSES